MVRRPILLNRPLKPKKAPAYRPGTKPVVVADAPASGLKRTARLAEKLEEARCGR